MSRPLQTRRLRPVGTLLNRLVLACLLPGILGSATFLISDYREERARLSLETAELAQSLGREVDTHLLRTQALGLALSRAKGLAGDQLGEFTVRAARAISSAGLGSNVVLYMMDQKRLVSMSQGSRTRTPRPAEAAAALAVLKEGKPVIAGLAAGNDSSGGAVSVHVPVVRDGKVVYSLAIDVPTTQLNALLLSRNLRPGWLASLIDPRGSIAARSRNTALIGQAATPALRDAIARSPAGSLETVTRDGVENFTAFWRSPQTGYTAVVGVPRAQLVAPLRAKMAGLAAGVALLFITGMLLARRMSRRIADSFHALIEPASALGNGEPPAIAPVYLHESAEVGAAIERAAALLQEREAALRRQQEELEQFRFFSDHANQMLLLLDGQGKVCYANRMTCMRLGYANAELLTMTLFQIDLPVTLERFQQVLSQCRIAPPPPFERIYTCKDGSSFPVEISATVLQHRDEWFMHVAARDIAERRKAEQEVRWAATHDPLTGVANRSLALDFLQQRLGEARAGNAGTAVLCIDLDRFKPVNDLYGHDVGDRVLQEAARRIQGALLDGDLLARFGGDEFVVVLARSGEPRRSAEAVAAAIIGKLEQSIRVGKIEVNLSACLGISCFPEHGEAPGELLHAADLAMLQVKQRGGGGVAHYTREMDDRAQFVLAVERRLQGALEHGGLALHYQPIVDLASGRTVGIEALLRLEDTLSPALGPADFIPVAESCGLISAIGEWVARESCAQQVAWQAAGLALHVSVNVSALQFRQPHFAARIRDLIASSGIDPRKLVLEVTETAVMENLAEAVAILQELKGLGVRIALDDFGTGYSSLSNLSALPLDKLKIDQSFVRRIDSDHSSRAVIDAVIALGHSLSLELIAEGIETRAARDYLRDRGCQLGQGYYFSRPLPQAALERWQQGRMDGDGDAAVH